LNSRRLSLIFLFARRYLVAKKSTQAINVISWIAVGGISIGTFALILILSVFNGFAGLVLSLYNQFTPDVVIHAAEGKSFVPDSVFMLNIKNAGEVKAVSPIIEENVLLRYSNNQCLARLKGVANDYDNVSGISSAVFHGNFLLTDDKQHPFIFLGAGVEQQLQINYDDPFGFISIYYPRKNVKTSLNPEEAFNNEQAKPSGSFAIQQEFDNRYAFVPIDLMRQLTERATDITTMEIALVNPDESEQFINNLKSKLDKGFTISNRYQQNEVLYKVMQSERWAVFAILGFVLLIASFNIIGAVAMLVIEKRKDIGVLKVLGFNDESIRGIFFSEGLLLATIGYFIGATLAFIICVLQQTFGLVKLGGGSFVIDAYPVHMQVLDFIVVFGMVTLIGLVASWLPSKRASASQLRMA
jgi:lipoprotein-releasing system permease protein